MTKFKSSRRIGLHFFYLLFFLFTFAYLIIGTPRADEPRDASQGECTVAIFSGAITSDGRPLLWKNRDVYNFSQRYIYFAPSQRDGIATYPFTGLIFQNDSTRVWMGTNLIGFSIMNSDSYNLQDTLRNGIDDGLIMKWALEVCSTLSDFEDLLDSTNISGRSGCWNFGVLDASGALAFYESANRSYLKFDPNDSLNSTPHYLVRANFSISGNGQLRVGSERYDRANGLIEQRLLNGRIDVEFILKNLSRDLGNIYADPYPFPYRGTQVNAPPGYIYDVGGTIDNRSTGSAAVLRGVRPGEDASLATIFAILGPPILSVAFPIWVKSGEVPPCLCGPGQPSVLTYCLQRRPMLYDYPQMPYMLNSAYLLDDDGHGVYSYTLPLEAWGIDRASAFIERFADRSPSGEEVRAEQVLIASTIFNGFENQNAEIGEGNDVIPGDVQLFNYPNPFNQGTRILYRGIDSTSPISLRIYDSLGRLVQLISGTNSDINEVNWTGTDMFGNRVASGVYFYKVRCGIREFSNKMTLIN